MWTMDLTTFETVAVWAVLGVAIVGLVYAVFLSFSDALRIAYRTGTITGILTNTPL